MSEVGVLSSFQIQGILSVRIINRVGVGFTNARKVYDDLLE
jgi:hypothetical protein